MPTIKPSNWDIKFLGLASYISSWSKDSSTVVGSVIIDNDNNVRSVGYNGFPRGIDDNKPERKERPLKYSYSCHAEANAISAASRTGIPLKGCTMYISFAPCCSCSLLIIQSGIQRVVYKEKVDERWQMNQLMAKEMLEEAGVVVNEID